MAEALLAANGVGAAAAKDAIELENGRIVGLKLWASAGTLTTLEGIDKLDALRTLSLNAIQIELGRDPSGELPALEKLEIGGRLRSFPDWIFRLPKLKYLHLGGNGFTELPERLATLPLRTLRCSSNPLKAFPGVVFALHDLRELALHLSLTTLPDELRGLQQLKTLDLTANKFSTVPPVIFQLRSLEVLLLGQNRIQTLPPAISELSELQRLELDHNLLTDLPDQLGDLKHLERFSVTFNRIPDPRAVVRRITGHEPLRGWDVMGQKLPAAAAKQPPRP